MIISNSLKFYKDKASIDKSINSNTAYQIKVYNDNLVDELVIGYDETGDFVRPTTAGLWGNLTALNKPNVYKNYNRIIQSKYTDNSNLFNVMIKNKADKDLNRIVESEIERINKNLDYTQEVITRYNVPKKAYQKRLREMDKNRSRVKTLQEVAIKQNEILASDGLNINNHVFSYKDIESTAESLLRQSQMTSGYEKAKATNDYYVNQGKDPVYTEKTWVHTHKAKTTRHMHMHNEKVRFDEPFLVIHDKTHQSDLMLYPCDPAGSPANSFICYCECDYGDNIFDLPKEDMVQIKNTQYQINAPVFSNADSINNIMAMRTGKGKVKPINTDADGISDVPYNYVVDGDKVHITYDDGKYYLNGLELNEYDLSTNTGKVSKNKVTKHNANIVDDTPAKTEVTNKPIDIDKLINSSTGNILIDATNHDFDEVDGKYYYNGLEVEMKFDDDGNLFYGKVPKSAIDEHNKQFKDHESATGNVAPNKEFIDINDYEINDGEIWVTTSMGLEEHNGKTYFKGLDVTDYMGLSGKLAYVPVDAIKNHNKQFENNNNVVTFNEPDNTFDVKKEELTSNFLKSIYYSDLEDEYTFFEHNLENIDGKYYIKGLDVTPYYNKDNKWADVPANVIKEHNKSLKNNTAENVSAKPEIEKIDADLLTYDYDINAYIVTKYDGVKEYNGDYYYKGLKLDYFENDEGFIDKKDIENHNKQIIQVNEFISKNDLIHSDEDGGYLVETWQLDKIGDEYYYHGLNVNVTDESKTYQVIPFDDVDKHNEQFNTTQNNETDDYGFKPIVKTTDYVHHKKSEVLKYGEDVDGQAYAVDKTGRQWVLDEQAIYEERQDRLQKQVPMDDLYNGVHSWGHSGYEPINWFNYLKKKFEETKYKKVQQKLFPLFDELRSAVNQGKDINNIEDKINIAINKFKDSGDFERDKSDYNGLFKVLSWIKDIEMAMAKSPPLQQDTCFIRAGHWKLDFNKVGEVFEWEGYAGITYKNRPVDLGHEGMSYNITILAPKGTRGVRLSRQFGGITPEREWLLPRGQKFKVLEFDEANHTCTIELIVEDW